MHFMKTTKHVNNDGKQIRNITLIQNKEYSEFTSHITRTSMKHDFTIGISSALKPTYYLLKWNKKVRYT